MSHYIYMHNDIQKNETPMNLQNSETTSRPLGYWLKAVDRLLSAEFAAAFEGQGATRRDWRLLNIVDDSVASDRPLRGPRVRALAERGWITRIDDSWTLTDEGRAAKDRLSEVVTTIRARVTHAVPAADLATTLATLETLAREFGWDENAPLPRKRRGHFGRRFGGEAHFAHDRRFDHGQSHSACEHADENPAHSHHGHPHHGCDHHGRHDHSGHRSHHEGGHRRDARHGERAFARGFEAGFLRGRDA